MALPLAAQTAAVPTKVAILQFQDAVLATQEGQAATAAMKAKYDPRKALLDKRRSDLQAIQDKLQGGATLTREARARMDSDLASGSRTLGRDVDDLNAEVQEEEGRILQSMSSKMGDVIKGYATKNGYTIVLDVSGEGPAVLWATPAVNITVDIVKLYDQAHPVKKSSAP